MEGAPRTPTMAEIAAEVGVSKMTVSLAFRGSERVSEATRNKVLEVADRLGYRPNPMVQTLMANLRATRKVELHSVIAWITAFETEDGWANTWVFQEYFKGAARRARHLGYRIEPFWLGAKGMTGKRLTEILKARGINGVIVPPVPSSLKSLDVDWSQFASATIGYSFHTPALHRVAANLREAMFLAIEKCEAMGYKRIGFVIPEETDTRVNHGWMSAYLSWQQFVSRKNLVPMLYVKRPQRVEDPLGPWLRKHNPDVVIAVNNELLEWLPDLFAIRVPEEVGLVFLAKRDAAGEEYSDVTGVNQRDAAVGAAAVDTVVAQIQRNEIGVPEHPNVLLCSGVWEEGNTTRHCGAKTKKGVKASKKAATK